MAADQGKVELLNTWPSMYGMRVLIALKERGVEYQYHHEDLPNNKSQLLLESNPIHKKIPVLIHDGKPICESLNIVQYIDETWPVQGKAFLPEDPYERALVRFWADYVDKKVLDAAGRIVRSPEGELQEQGKKDFMESLITVDSALRDAFCGKPYFGGDQIGLMDIALAPINCWLKAYEALAGVRPPDERECPHLHAWMKRVVEYPCVKEAMLLAPPDNVVDYAHKLRKRVLGAS